MALLVSVCEHHFYFILYIQYHIYFSYKLTLEQTSYAGFIPNAEHCDTDAMFFISGEFSTSPMKFANIRTFVLTLYVIFLILLKRIPSFAFAVNPELVIKRNNYLKSIKNYIIYIKVKIIFCQTCLVYIFWQMKKLQQLFWIVIFWL